MPDQEGSAMQCAFVHEKNENYKYGARGIPASLRNQSLSLGAILAAFGLFFVWMVSIFTGQMVIWASAFLIPFVVMGRPFMRLLRKCRRGQAITGTITGKVLVKIPKPTGTAKHLKMVDVDMRAFEFSFTSPVTGLELSGKEVGEIRRGEPEVGSQVVVHFVDESTFSVL
jgi:hypothetical protein